MAKRQRKYVHLKLKEKMHLVIRGLIELKFHKSVENSVKNDSFLCQRGKESMSSVAYIA